MKTLRIALPLAALMLLVPFVPASSADAGILHENWLWLKVTRKSGWGWGPGYHVHSNPRPNAGMFHQPHANRPTQCQGDRDRANAYYPTPAEGSNEAASEALPAPQPALSLDPAFYQGE